MYQSRHAVEPDKKKTKVREEIDANLKRVYSDALKEDVPDKLKQLLAQLREKEQQK